MVDHGSARIAVSCSAAHDTGPAATRAGSCRCQMLVDVASECNYQRPVGDTESCKQFVNETNNDSVEDVGRG